MRLARSVSLSIALGLTLALVVPSVVSARERFPRRLDPQSWEVPEDMTWRDYKPVPRVPYYDKDFEPTLRTLRAALILGDFPDYKFRVAATKRDVTGQKVLGVEDPARFWLGYLFRNENPKSYTRGHTVDEYWLENSYGLIGVDAEAFGPYRMEKRYHEYGILDFGSSADCPQGSDCEGQTGFDTELVEKSLADVTASQTEHGEFDFRFLLHAGYDESGTWLNYGQALFTRPEAVTEKWGPRFAPNHRNWATTRYVPWSSWWSSQHIWSHALPGLLSTQGESDGGSTYAHELSHIFGILDNYNNPYDENPKRSYSGPWDMMSRGTFNGPGGPFERWTIPPREGGTMGSHHMIRNKLRLGFLPPSEVRTITRSALDAAGIVRTRILQRESPPLTADAPPSPADPQNHIYSGMRIVLGEDQRTCDYSKPKCDGGNYDNYDIEVVNRQGFDSFIPDHGVLIAKTKNGDVPAPFIWVIDSHPKNLNKVDYVRADGEKFRYTVGDYRQLSDAAFHVGTAKGVKNRYKDKANG
ncbi:MAG: peptidase M6, partial [Actinomycetota bacterium]|nr:peptidase M6 [Actinomycetota bacterium]